MNLWVGPVRRATSLRFPAPLRRAGASGRVNWPRPALPRLAGWRCHSQKAWARARSHSRQDRTEPGVSAPGSARGFPLFSPWERPPPDSQSQLCVPVLTHWCPAQRREAACRANRRRHVGAPAAPPPGSPHHRPPGLQLVAPRTSAPRDWIPEARRPCRCASPGGRPCRPALGRKKTGTAADYLAGSSREDRGAGFGPRRWALGLGRLWVLSRDGAAPAGSTSWRGRAGDLLLPSPSAGPGTLGPRGRGTDVRGKVWVEVRGGVRLGMWGSRSYPLH